MLRNKAALLCIAIIFQPAVVCNANEGQEFLTSPASNFERMDSGELGQKSLPPDIMKEVEAGKPALGDGKGQDAIESGGTIPDDIKKEEIPPALIAEAHPGILGAHVPTNLSELIPLLTKNTKCDTYGKVITLYHPDSRRPKGTALSEDEQKLADSFKKYIEEVKKDVDVQRNIKATFDKKIIFNKETEQLVNGKWALTVFHFLARAVHNLQKDAEAQEQKDAEGQEQKDADGQKDDGIKTKNEEDTEGNEPKNINRQERNSEEGPDQEGKEGLEQKGESKLTKKGEEAIGNERKKRQTQERKGEEGQEQKDAEGQKYDRKKVQRRKKAKIQGPNNAKEKGGSTNVQKEKTRREQGLKKIKIKQRRAQNRPIDESKKTKNGEEARGIGRRKRRERKRQERKSEKEPDQKSEEGPDQEGKEGLEQEDNSKLTKNGEEARGIGSKKRKRQEQESEEGPEQKGKSEKSWLSPKDYEDFEKLTMKIMEKNLFLQGHNGVNYATLPKVDLHEFNDLEPQPYLEKVPKECRQDKSKELDVKKLSVKDQNRCSIAKLMAVGLLNIIVGKDNIIISFLDKPQKTHWLYGILEKLERIYTQHVISQRRLNGWHLQDGNLPDHITLLRLINHHWALLYLNELDRIYTNMKHGFPGKRRKHAALRSLHKELVVLKKSVEDYYTSLESRSTPKIQNEMSKVKRGEIVINLEEFFEKRGEN